MSPQQKNFFETVMPFVRFKILSSNNSLPFLEHIHRLLIDFLTYANKCNIYPENRINLSETENGGMKGQLVSFFLESRSIGHIFIEIRNGNEKEIIFHDCFQIGGAYCVFLVYLTARSFGFFLRQQKVSFERFGMKREGETETFQGRFLAQ
jgi:hypothetical protein